MISGLSLWFTWRAHCNRVFEGRHESPSGDNLGHLVGTGSHSLGTVLAALVCEELVPLSVGVEGGVVLHHL